MNEEVKILAMPTAAKIGAEGMKKLREYGVVIVRCDSPSDVRLLRPALDVDVLPANEFMWAAVDALAQKREYNDVEKMRQLFLANLANLMKNKLSLPIPVDNPEKKL